jgi:hypothetical protein
MRRRPAHQRRRPFGLALRLRTGPFEGAAVLPSRASAGRSSGAAAGARSDQVPPEAFAAALRLRRACLSPSPEESGDGVLTLDQGILPLSRDPYVFAARFSIAGDLLRIAEES